MGSPAFFITILLYKDEGEGSIAELALRYSFPEME